MTESSLRPLNGARIWLSASIPDEALDAEKDSILKFIEDMSLKVFLAGGSIIHGCHPTIWPTLLKAASKFKGTRDARDRLELAVSRYFSKEPERYNIQLDEWRSHSTVHEVPAATGADEKSKSLELLRRWIVDRWTRSCCWEVNGGGKIRAAPEYPPNSVWRENGAFLAFYLAVGWRGGRLSGAFARNTAKP